MIYSKDQWIQLPTKDLYDSQIMLASINAARDMYEKGLQETKEFNKLYGDFTSPIARDVDYWYDNTLKPVRDAVNYMYDKGIDPTRSAEGRALIQKLINQAPVAKLNQIRQSAKIADEYVKNRGTMQANGLYDPGFEQFALRDQYGRPVDLSTWSTIDDGTWERTAPYKYESLYDYTSPMFKDLKPHELTKAEVESFGVKYDPRYQYQGISKGDLERVTGQRVPGVQNDTLYKYYRDRAADVVRKQYIAAGKNPAEITQDEIDRQFVQDVIQANSARIVEPTKTADQFAVMAQGQANDMQKLRFQQDREDARFNKDLAYKYWADQQATGRAMMSAGLNPNTGAPLSGSGNESIARGVYDRLLDDVATNLQQRDEKYLASFKAKANNTYSAFLRAHQNSPVHDNSGRAWTGRRMANHYFDVARKKGYRAAEKWLVKNFNKSWHRAKGTAFWRSFDQYRLARKEYEMPGGKHRAEYIGEQQGISGTHLNDADINRAFQDYLIQRDVASAATLRSAIPMSEVKDKNGRVQNYQGVIGPETTLATIGKVLVVTGMGYSYKTPERKLDRAIKGLTFTIAPGDVNTAQYGAGTGLRYSKGMRGLIVHKATFSKAELKKRGFDPDKYRSRWGHFGITDSKRPGYIDIQVMTDISGSQAALNIKGDKEWGGSAYSKSRIARNQAMQEERAAME